MATAQQLEAIWSAARQKYQAASGVDPDGSSVPQLQSVDQLLDLLEARNKGKHGQERCRI